MKNEKIGMLGEAFIQRQLEFGIEFEEAWDDWQRVQDKLAFIIECPEVQYYDDRRVSDVQERKRIREYAKSRLGEDIRSADVSMLGRVAVWLEIEVPVRPYHMDRNVVGDWLVRRAEIVELEDGMGEDAARSRHLAESEKAIESISIHIEEFAEAHSLWAVPPERLLGLFLDHQERLLQTSFTCDVCKEEIVIPVDHEAGDFQRFRIQCPRCNCWNRGTMVIPGNGEARVLSNVADEDSGGGNAEAI